MNDQGLSGQLLEALRRMNALAAECYALSQGMVSANDIGLGESPLAAHVDGAYCVIALNVQGADTQELLQTIIPAGDGDTVVCVSPGAFAIVKTLDDDTQYEDAIQLAHAIYQTLEDEQGYRATIGLSDAHKGGGRESLSAAYAEAQAAITAGRKYNAAHNVYAHRAMLLERLLSDLPQDTLKKYHAMLLNKRTQRLFDEEMTRTVDTFFDNNLNLAETARRLYIHRNTLVYRLDKIQRMTGLDLRQFRDAMTLKLLLMIK